MNERYIPKRKCIVCQTRIPKAELIRITKNGDFFEVMKKDGRGAYVCRNDACILKIEKTNALSRGFKTKVSDEAYKKLTEELLEL